MRWLVLIFAALALCACEGMEPAPPEGPAPPYDGPVDIHGDPIGPRSVVSLGEACGGMMGLTCQGAESGSTYCAYEPVAMCGAADQMGECAIVPVACPAIDRPVCGCDGQTYANACQARAARTSVVSFGPCAPVYRIGEPVAQGDG